MTGRLGTDLAVVLGPPGMAAHDAAALDLRLAIKPAQRPTLPPGTPATGAQGDRPEPGTAEIADLATVSDRHNLAQALILRLLTPRGALAALGHATYGSRLHELIGESKTEALRARCRAFVLETVAAEPRVDDTAVAFAFDPLSEGPSEFRFTVAVRPRTEDGNVELSLAVGL
jgi:phage baseplate assembly protein W